MEPGGPQARKPLQRLPLQDMNGSRTWPMGSASWPRYTPRNILISRSSREIRACATTRRAPARQPPDRPSHGEIFSRDRNHSARTESVDSIDFAHASDNPIPLSDLLVQRMHDRLCGCQFHVGYQDSKASRHCAHNTAVVLYTYFLHKSDEKLNHADHIH